MKKMLFLSALVFATFAASTSYASVNSRQHEQRERIHQGVRSGELTRAEAQRLREGERQVAQTEARMRARNNGNLTNRDRARLHVMQDNLSHQIYAKKHNSRDRN